MAILIDEDSSALTSPGDTPVGPLILDPGIYQLVASTAEITAGDVARVYVSSAAITGGNYFEFGEVVLIDTSFPLLHTIGPITLPYNGAFTLEVVSMVGSNVAIEWSLIQLATIDS